MLNLNALFADAKNLSEKFQLNPCFRVTHTIFGVSRQIMFHGKITLSNFMKIIFRFHRKFMKTKNENLHYLVSLVRKIQLIKFSRQSNLEIRHLLKSRQSQL